MKIYPLVSNYYHDDLVTYQKKLLINFHIPCTVIGTENISVKKNTQINIPALTEVIYDNINITKIFNSVLNQYITKSTLLLGCKHT